MNPVFLFRLSILLHWACSGAGILYALVAESFFPQDWQDLMAWNGNGSVFPENLREASVPIGILIGAITLFALISTANQVFLLFFWKPARSIYLASCIIQYPMILLFGLSILSPVEVMFYEMAALLSGVTLALAFYSPVADRFK